MWIKIKSTNYRYEVNENGQVRMCETRVKNNINGGTRKVGGKILSPKTKSNGYKEVNLSVSPGKSKSFYVHRLVAECFLGGIEKGLEVNHKDGDKSNNHKSNLEIVTPSENMKHAYKKGFNKPPRMIGSKHKKSKITEKDVLYIRENKDGLTQKELGDKYGLKQSTVSNIVLRQTWKHI